MAHLREASASGDSFGSFEANAGAGAEVVGPDQPVLGSNRRTVRGGNVRIVSAEGDIPV